MNRSEKTFLILSLVVTQALPLLGRETLDDRSPLHQPLETSQGLVYSTADASQLWLVSGTSQHLLASDIGCGLYVNLSPDRQSIGIKFIDENGRQTPAVINLQDGKLTPLWPPSEQAGQVSFTTDGRCAFTIGENLIVLDGTSTKIYRLGTYANLAPISPDGRYVAYNDTDDQLWIMELSTSNRTRLTQPDAGYWFPSWSPDASRLLFKRLDSKLYIYELSTQQTVAVGEGSDPVWSPDSRFVVFTKKDVRNMELVNADLYLATSDGRAVLQLTDTDSLQETEASFQPDGSALVFRSYNTDRIYRAPFSQQSLRLGQVQSVASIEQQPSNNTVIRPGSSLAPASVTALKIPYINQVYDTPDWFNGHAACGPTSSMMVLAYYNVLPRWDTWCSSPSPGHTSWWGRYICERYYFRQRDYSSTADDPSGHPGAGAYGFMWASGSPHSTMESYYAYHGLSAQLTDAPPYSKAVAEVNAGFPYTICVGLTTSGHIVVTHGLGTAQGTVIVHDPYGNKNLINTNGYPNYQGRNVPYDWPGYNNGYQNLNDVFWAVSAHGSSPTPADTLVDDTQYGMGFYLHTSPPASMTRWKDLTRGYANHAWFAYTRAASMDTCYATWTPNLALVGSYEVLAYIPISRATAAHYVIVHKDGADTIVVNQRVITDSWVSLGTYRFDQGTSGFVRLGDASDTTGQEIVFDAVRWSLRSTSAVETALNEQRPSGFELTQNYPNPFNPSTHISFTLGSESDIRLSVCNILGEEVDIIDQGRRSRGTHEIEWPATHLPSGVYLGVLEANPCSGGQVLRMTRKMLLVR